MFLPFLGFEIEQNPILRGLSDFCVIFWASCANFPTCFTGGGGGGGAIFAGLSIFVFKRQYELNNQPR